MGDMLGGSRRLEQPDAAVSAGDQLGDRHRPALRRSSTVTRGESAPARPSGAPRRDDLAARRRRAWRDR